MDVWQHFKHASDCAETCLHGKVFSGIFDTNYTGNQISKNLKWKQVFIIQICKYKIKPIFLMKKYLPLDIAK